MSVDRHYLKLRTKSIGSLVIVTLLALVQMPGDTSSARVPMQQGVSYAAWWSGLYSEPGADLSLRLLASTGATWISLIVTRYQDTIASTTINPPGVNTPTDEDLVHVIQYAHSLGLKVMLKPHLDLPDERETGIWRGHIGTEFTTEAQWAAWFASYRDFIGHYALLAQANGADQFCVGTELLGTTQREAQWREVVATVRALYHGPLVYAALHGGEETSIQWWDAVDYIGVDAYYPLSSDLGHHPSVQEFESAWTAPKAVLAALAAQYGKPILLTEIGYRSQHGCGTHPWDSVVVSTVDMEEQANAYEAAFRELYNEPWLGGMFWWSWQTDRFQSGPCDDSYTPHGKPAEAILRAWYGGPPPVSQSLLVPDYGQAMDVYTDDLVAGWRDWSWGGTVHPGATDQVHQGARALAVTLQPWGALSLQHPSFRSDPYQWLEFYIRGSFSTPPKLEAFFHTADGRELPAVPLSYCSFVEGQVFRSDTWLLVRIPLSELNTEGLSLSRLNIQNESSQDNVSFWVDEVRLVGAKEPADQIFLPVTLRDLR